MQDLLEEAKKVMNDYAKLSDKIDAFRATSRQNKASKIDLVPDDIRVINMLLEHKESFNALGEYVLEILCEDNVLMDANIKRKLKNMLTCALEENIFN